MLRPLDVEHALGAEFTLVRQEVWRTVAVLVHLPKFVMDALAQEPTVPFDLSLDVRIEQLLIELFLAHLRSTTDVTNGDVLEWRRPR